MSKPGKKSKKPKEIPVMAMDVGEEGFKHVLRMMLRLGAGGPEGDVLPLHKGHGPADPCTPDCGPTKVDWL